MTEKDTETLTPAKQETINEFITFIKDSYGLTLDMFTKLNDWTFRFLPLEVDLYPTKRSAYYYKSKKTENIFDALDRIKAYLNNPVTNVETGDVKTIYLDELNSEKFYKITNSAANWKRLLDAVAFVSLNPNKKTCNILKQVVFEVLKDLPREFFNYTCVSESE